MREIDFFSTVALQIYLFKDEKTLGTASGFIYPHKGSLYFITNWHVLSGRKTYDGQPLKGQAGLIPNFFQILFHGIELGSSFLSPRTDLQQEDIQNDIQASWLQHELGQEVDIAAIRIGTLPPFVKAYFPTENNCTERISRSIGTDCFVVGYPLSHNETRTTVVWKRGTIATEYELDFNSKRCFLVDTTTSTGMSGSPVFLRRSAGVAYESGNFAFQPSPTTEFLGIYSGRYVGTDASELNLGYVWKRELIEEMLDSPKSGSYVLLKPE